MKGKLTKNRGIVVFLYVLVILVDYSATGWMIVSSDDDDESCDRILAPERVRKSLPSLLS